jgi:hypothetical protein
MDVSFPLAQGDLQRQMMTEETLKSWDAWTSFTVELKVVRALLPLYCPLLEQLSQRQGSWRFLRISLHP